jgi:hypothetical protein
MRIFVCSRLRADTADGLAANIARAKRICRNVALHGFSPYAPHLFFTQFLNDSIPAEREAGIVGGIEWLRASQELWAYVGDGVSDGMEREIALAIGHGIKVRRFMDEAMTMEESRIDHHDSMLVDALEDADCVAND